MSISTRKHGGAKMGYNEMALDEALQEGFRRGLAVCGLQEAYDTGFKLGQQDASTKGAFGATTLCRLAKDLNKLKGPGCRDVPSTADFARLLECLAISIATDLENLHESI